MMKPVQIAFAFFVAGAQLLHAQPFLAKVGTSFFVLNDGAHSNHFFYEYGGTLEHQIQPNFAVGIGIHAAKVVSAIADPFQGYVDRLLSAEAELRFYPNNKGGGFYAGFSIVGYKDWRILKESVLKSTHLGGHINVGFQQNLSKGFVIQANSQIGVYGNGYATVSRYGLEVMLGKKF